MAISLPKVTFNIIPGQEEISNAPQKVLIIGQKVAAGTATSGDLQQNIQNNSEENTLFGENSMISAMIRGFKLINDITRIDAISLDDNGSAVDATGTVAFTGTATESGTLEVLIGSERNQTFELGIQSGDTATVIGALLETVVGADTKSPVGAANVTGTVTLTAVNGGTVGNIIGLRVKGAVAGISVVVTGMASGATDPVLTSVFDVIGNERYQTIVAPFQYGTSFFTDFLDPRFNPTNRVLDGVGIMTSTDTLSNLLTTGNAENSQSLVIAANRIVDKTGYRGSASFELDHVFSSYFAAIRSKRLTEGANVANLVISNVGSVNSFGGSQNASLPYFNTIVSPLALIDLEEEWSPQELDQLKAAGIATFDNNIARLNIILGEAVTTRKKDAAGNDELTFRFLNSVDTSSVIREFYFNNNRARFSQTVLTDGDIVPNANIANESVIRAFQISLYDSVAGLLAQSGEDALNFFKQNLSIELDILNGLVTINMQVPIVGQLREIAGNISIVFSTNS